MKQTTARIVAALSKPAAETVRRIVGAFRRARARRRPGRSR
jgi:hypothetical protein